jgi:ATP-binding cassette, subfamily B, bacterial
MDKTTETSVTNAQPDFSTVPFSGPFSYLAFITRPYRGWVFAALLVVIVAAAFEQSLSYLFKLIIDSVEAGDSKQALFWGLMFPVALFIVQCSFRVSGLLGKIVTNNTRRDGYNFLFDHILKHGHTYFSNRFAGGIHSKIRNVVEGVDNLIPEILWTYLTSFVALVVTFVFIVLVDVPSAMVFLLLLLVMIIVNLKLSPGKQARAYAHAEAASRLHAGMIDSIANVSATRQYAQTRYETDRVARLNQTHWQTGNASWNWTEWMLFANGTLLFIFGSIMFYLLVNRWEAGEVSTGEFVLVASLITQLSGTLIFIGRAFNSTARTLGEMREGFAELFLPLDIVDVPHAQDLAVSGGTVTFADVSFTYDQYLIFNRFSLTVPQGQRVGVVGPSGAGKSTLVSLLLRQHNLTSGQITIDGHDIASVTQHSLRQAIAIVPQEPVLFHRTIKENIMYGNQAADDAAVIEAARKAEAHEFIMALPQGYDTLVGERGVKLSGGQKQRVAIARAILKNAPILVLDEATSALDSESEVAIQKALHNLMAGKTVLAIAHRLSTLREMDRLIVLENGEVAEDGTHDSLKDAGGTYSRLWAHQAGGFITE